MSDEPQGTPWGMCAAFGCPLVGSFGVGGKWYCCCHFRANPQRNDEITMMLRNSPLTRSAIEARKFNAGYKAIMEAEDRLIELTSGDAPKPTAPVIGPTHAMTHYTEIGES